MIRKRVGHNPNRSKKLDYHQMNPKYRTKLPSINLGLKFKKLRKRLFDRLCEWLLPKYIRFWPSYYWLAVWSAPVRYEASMNLPACNDTSWQALRITIRKGPAHSEIVWVIKKGTI